MNKSTRFFLAFLFLINYSAKGKANSVKTFDIIFQCESEDNDLKNINVSIFEIVNGTNNLIKTFLYKSKFENSFEQNKEFIVKFEKSGFTTKEIEISTKEVPMGRWKKGFYQFDISVKLSRLKDDNAVVPVESTIKIQYSELKQDFEFKQSIKRMNQNADAFPSYETKADLDYPINYIFINSKLNEVIKEENQMGSIMGNLNYNIQIGTDLYPNKKTIN